MTLDFRGKNTQLFACIAFRLRWEEILFSVHKFLLANRLKLYKNGKIFYSEIKYNLFFTQFNFSK